ncbi:S ribonuclease [Pyrus ussuriensis x Pyrus communis]|uniref:S ribonuclease n=1 Tax=Pyrus ussuriensis x Pyrus communis TaxID=2448454 RepID=A0A5N5HHE6_9ROSA|nr:S ribonuclease [Pyrus ussuriensis x Pyrus communis]
MERRRESGCGVINERNGKKRMRRQGQKGEEDEKTKLGVEQAKKGTGEDEKTKAGTTTMAATGTTVAVGSGPAPWQQAHGKQRGNHKPRPMPLCSSKPRR